MDLVVQPFYAADYHEKSLMDPWLRCEIEMSFCFLLQSGAVLSQAVRLSDQLTRAKDAEARLLLLLRGA